MSEAFKVIVTDIQNHCFAQFSILHVWTKKEFYESSIVKDSRVLYKNISIWITSNAVGSNIGRLQYIYFVSKMTWLA